MKIKDTAARLYSSHTEADFIYAEESFRYWVGKNPDEQDAANGDQLSLSTKATDLLGIISPNTGDTSTGLLNANESKTDATDDNSGLDNKTEVELKLIEMMFEQMTGKKLNVTDTYERMKKAFDEINQENAELTNTISNNGTTASADPGYGLEYSKKEILYQAENTTFQAEGVINTADGKSITFNLSFELSREFIQENNIDIRLGNAVKIDPLVLNYDGNSAGLTEDRIDFDINSDGKTENMAGLAPGSGFLVLDLNNDGAVNDGSELFGPQTGNGFKELEKLDSDKNSWIDENDKDFNKLKVWDGSGNTANRLISLKEKDVGAIYLKNASTPFKITTKEGQELGNTITTGIYLKDSGSVSTIQELTFLV